MNSLRRCFFCFFAIVIACIGIFFSQINAQEVAEQKQAVVANKQISGSTKSTITLRTPGYELRPIDGNVKIIDMNNDGAILLKESFFDSTGVRIRTAFSLDLPDTAYGLLPGRHELLGLDPTYPIEVSALNDSGIVVGVSRKTRFGKSTPTKWVSGQPVEMQVIGDVPSSRELFITDINNSGMMSGGDRDPYSFSGFFVSNPYFFNEPQYVGLTLPTCDRLPFVTNQFIGINDAGDVFGDIGCFSSSGALQQTVGVWRAGSHIYEEFSSDLSLVRFKDFNNADQALGFKIFPSRDSPVILERGNKVTIIPAPDNYPNAFMRGTSMNDAGQVVGSFTFADPGANCGSINGYLWLPTDAYGFTAGLHNLNDIVKDDPLIVGGVLGRALFINNQGEIIAEKWVSECVPGSEGGYELKSTISLFVLTPNEKSGIVVNSTGDDPDLNPGDGFCNAGRGDCTLRAAIEEANALEGEDKISFNIPGGGLPVIKPLQPLPDITDPVVIDGASQPTVNQVEIDGSNMLSSDGLRIVAGKSTVRHLLINNFQGDGLLLITGDSNTVGNLSIGVGPDGTSDRGNAGHGIKILFSSYNTISDVGLNTKNIIAHNGLNGVFVEGGVGNRISGNSIFSNGRLGIDLAPAGVTPNDSGDGDAGTNNLINYPVLDSIEAGLVTTFWGTLNAPGNRTYTIDIYSSDSCDASGFGEGKDLVESIPIFVGVDGVTEFAIQGVGPPTPGKFYTATTTDGFGNTSEFSRCLSAKVTRFVDIDNKPIANTRFGMFTVANDAPLFTETFVDFVDTDSSGTIDLTPFSIAKGVSLKFSKQVNSILSPNRATTPKSALSVNLDNALFDSTTSEMSYFKTSDDLGRAVRMSHTTVAINLYVSIEFDATVSYYNNLQQAFRLASNYLYDVTDGQARLDTVFITDNKVGWNVADIAIFASNMQWARAVPNALLTKRKPVRFYMPRKFYGNKKANRNSSAVENPLNPATPNNYRTFVHELGHYAFGFGDEYVFVDRFNHCLSVDEFGFMQYQYPGSPDPRIPVTRSEMSREEDYVILNCRNTAQYARNLNSCWNQFEATYEKTYDGLLSPIIMPDERNIPIGESFLIGPNDDLSNPDVNVGAKIVFLGANNPPALLPLRALVLSEDGVTPAVNIEIAIEINSTGRVIKQGNTSDDGHLIFMGAPSAYTYIAEGVTKLAGAASGSSSLVSGIRIKAPSQFSWAYGEGALPDSGDIVLSEVQGELPLIPNIAPSASGFEYSLLPFNQFQSAPSLITSNSNQLADSSDFLFDGTMYRATVLDTSSTEYDLTVRALDTVSNRYFFNSLVTVVNLSDSSSFGNAAGRVANFSVSLDSSVSATKKVFLETDYPPIRTGLSPDQRQAGKVGVIQTVPVNSTLSGVNTLQIRYPEGDISGNGIDSTIELTLKIHHWNEATGEWKLIGGRVDTAANEVSAQITEPGVYAAFTTNLFPSNCCLGSTGNIDCDPNGIVDITDLTVLIDHLFIGLQPLCCKGAGNIDGDPAGIVDITDLATLIDHLFLSLTPTSACQ